MLTKEQAKANLQWLIDTAIRKGGIFNNAAEVASVVNALEIYGADETPAARPALAAVKGTAAEQLQARIDNDEK